MVHGLQSAGCRIIRFPDPNHAPFKLVFRTADDETVGVILYLFTITSVLTKNRPEDECRFQIKYGSKDGKLHEIWQDSRGLYTTIFAGIDPETGCWVAADPTLHNPTLFFISLEFKKASFEAAKGNGWHAWERESSINLNQPVEVLVGGMPNRFLDLVRFERAAKGLPQGERHLLAQKVKYIDAMRDEPFIVPATKIPGKAELHELAQEFEMSSEDILSLIGTAPRLKMAVRGWVAQDHLQRQLSNLMGVTGCERLEGEGQPDIRLNYKGRPVLIECKNVLRNTTKDGFARLDFQRTRASKSNPCSRYYKPEEFDVVAACLHAVTEQWEFRFRQTSQMQPHKECVGRLSQQVKIDDQWDVQAVATLSRAAGVSQ